MKIPIASASSPSAPISRSRDVIGNILQDEKIPGVHIAFGNPYGATPARTGIRRLTSTSSAAVSTSRPTTADHARREVAL
ncbi:MAG: hypothetical protein QM757_46675 [Paludibaculum sp.]